MKLGSGEIKCDRCNGVGFTPNNGEHESICSKCHGVGKLDWIEVVVGKNLGFIITKQKLNPQTRQIENRYYYGGTEIR